ncbi:MAG: putative zinc-binding protein [Acidobacteriia bacterium]|nr:putative zinc-binding protein [Terriglobia bacterium]
MPELPKRKIGLVSCSGEEMAEGTVTRLATLQVLETLRSDETVTICLPLFLAGGEGDRAFARFYPTIAIDGCDKRCAARGTEMYSSKPASSIVVSELCPAGAGELGTARHLNEAGMAAVNAVAAEIARQVDRLLGTRSDRSQGAFTVDGPAVKEEVPGAATCSCASGIPVKVLDINGRKVEILALPLILEMFREAGKPAIDETAAEMLETVRLYNQIPEGEDASWKLVLGREYASYCAEGS